MVSNLGIKYVNLLIWVATKSRESFADLFYPLPESNPLVQDLPSAYAYLVF